MAGFDQIEFIFCSFADWARSYLFVQMSGQMDSSLNVYLKAVRLSVWSGWHASPCLSELPSGWKLQSVLEIWRHGACQCGPAVRFSWKSTFHADNLEHTFIVNNSGLIITSVHTPQIKSWCTLTHSYLIPTSSFLNKTLWEHSQHRLKQTLKALCL